MTRKEKLQVVLFLVVFVIALIECGRVDTMFIMNGMIP